MTHGQIDHGAVRQTLTGVASATEDLVTAVAALDGDAVRAASRLPGWSRGHVLTHLARHADALRRITDAALHKELIDPYPGGPAGKAAEIASGAARPPAVIVRDLVASADALAQLWRDLPAETWGRQTRAVTGTRPLAAGATARWVEVQVHHVDLDVGHRPADWPDDFVAAATRYVLGGLPGRMRGTGPGPDEDWLLSATDLGTQWRVHRADDRFAIRTVDPADAGRAAVHGVTGPGHALLTWLLGRSPDGAGLAVANPADAGRAFALPGHFPFP